MDRVRFLVVLATYLLAITLQAAASTCHAISTASFWISKHGIADVGSSPPVDEESVLQIDRLLGSGVGTFYIWARPAENKTLLNWSLNVISSNPEVLRLTSAQLALYNTTLNGIATGTTSKRRWEYMEEPSATQAKIENLSGFSLFGTEGTGVGIGSINLAGNYNDPYYNREKNSWLMARVDYEYNNNDLEGDGNKESNVFLEIGTQGASHFGDESSADTEIIFGAQTDTALNAMHERMSDYSPDAIYTPDAIFRLVDSVTPVADLDGDGRTNNRDLKIWQASYGEGDSGDADGDGQTNGRDLLFWQRQFDGTPGDFNGDGQVNGRDFLAWQRNPRLGNLADWQTNFGNEASLRTLNAVPEPGSLLSFGAVCICSIGISRSNMQMR